MRIDKYKLIAECSAYDFKEALERKKTKSWLKSVSAFANGNGGSLYYGIADDGTVVGLADAQADAEFISEAIKVRIDPVPEFQLLPHTTDEEKVILEVKVATGGMTPYYYYFDGARTAFVRVGNERQLDFMEKRGSGLRKIRRESAMLPNYTEDRKPFFHSEGTQFSTIFKNVNYKKKSAPEDSGLESGLKSGLESIANRPQP